MASAKSKGASRSHLYALSSSMASARSWTCSRTSTRSHKQGEEIWWWRGQGKRILWWWWQERGKSFRYFFGFHCSQWTIRVTVHSEQ